MAGTTFETVIDSFMLEVEDYKLVSLFNISQTDFLTYVSAWLIASIPEFKNCNQSLIYSATTFTETLTQENINILVLLMKKRWLQKQVDDIKQMNLAVTDKDFKRFAESNNMLAKQKRLTLLQEELSQALVNYGLDSSTLWSNWITSGIFYTP